MRKVLVIRFSSLGDVVLTGPVFQAIRQAWPDAEITALTKEAYADVLRGNPAIDAMLLLQPGESIVSMIRRVRREHFDVVVDLHANLRSRLVGLFSGARQRVRYQKAALARRLFVRWRRTAPELQQHTLDRYLHTLGALGMGGPPEKILVIQTAFLGDAVLTLPFLTALMDTYPQASITVLCTPEIADVFERQPGVDACILFDKRGRDRSLGAFWRMARRLRAQQFPIAFLPHRSARSALLAWFSGIPRRVGFSTSQGRWFLTDVVPFRWGVHDADRNVALLDAVGAQGGVRELTLSPDPQARRRIEERLQAAGVSSGDRVLGINAGSVWPTKRWLAEGYAAVADRVIRELGMPVIFFGGPSDRDVIAAVLGAMHEKALNWAGQTNLRELIAAVARCSVFLTNDSGPMHIAVAGRVPTVAIFGPTTRELGFFPYGDGHLVIEKELPCRPCGLHGAKKCPLGHFQCMHLITPQEVFEAVARQVASAGAARTVRVGAP